MQFDPLYQHKKIQDDWAPIPNKTKYPKRKLILLPTRKYVKYKGTMKRVRVEPAPAIPCVVMKWMEGQINTVPCGWMEDEKILFPLAMNSDGHRFNSRMEAKHAIWHTVQQSGVLAGHVDFVIVNL